MKQSQKMIDEVKGLLAEQHAALREGRRLNEDDVVRYGERKTMIVHLVDKLVRHRVKFD